MLASLIATVSYMPLHTKMALHHTPQLQLAQETSQDVLVQPHSLEPPLQETGAHELVSISQEATPQSQLDDAITVALAPILFKNICAKGFE